MKVKDILNYNDAIKGIINNTSDINSLIKFKLLGICKQFESIINNFEQIREEKIIQYGTVNSEGVTGIFSPNKEDYQNDDDYNKALSEFEQSIDNFKNDLNEILNSDVDMVIKKFKYSDIMDAGIPTDYLIAIYDLIEE